MLKMLRLKALFITCLFAGISNADIAPEQASVKTLAAPSPHWVWMTDISYPNFVPGTAHLLDADRGKFLGMLTMGYGLTALGLPTHGNEIYAVETHYSRTTRGERKDFVVIYSAKDLSAVSEIAIPPKKLSAVPMLSFVGLTDDDQFLLVYNFTPSQSVSLVDVQKRRFVAEIETAGCGLTLPAGNRRFLMLCGNGDLRDITFNDNGEVISNRISEKIFDRKKEFLTEKAMRLGNTWFFVSNEGEIQEVEVSADGVNIKPRWPLFSSDELAAGWKIGGQQHLAIHQKDQTLYAAVHQGGLDSHKDPGTHIFVYDLDSRQKKTSIELTRPANAMQVTQDDKPLLITTNAYPAIVDIYDAREGSFIREVGEAGISPMTLQTPFNR